MKSKMSFLTVFIIVAMAVAVAAVFLRPQAGGESNTAASARVAPAVTDTGGSTTAYDIPEGFQFIQAEELWTNPDKYNGSVAVEGFVTKVFADRGYFLIVDVSETECCPEGSCAEFTIPVKVTEAEFAGALPAAFDTVVIIGTVETTPEKKGFELTVNEVRKGSDVIMTRKETAA